jgi:hypothetical protein
MSGPYPRRYSISGVRGLVELEVDPTKLTGLHTWSTIKRYSPEPRLDVNQFQPVENHLFHALPLPGIMRVSFASA